MSNSSELERRSVPLDHEPWECKGGRRLRFVESMSPITSPVLDSLAPPLCRKGHSASVEEGIEVRDVVPLWSCGVKTGAVAVMEGVDDGEEAEVDVDRDLESINVLTLSQRYIASYRRLNVSNEEVGPSSDLAR